jgi:hypothetical protein
MYANANFEEQPLFGTADKCTHLSTYNNDAVKVQVCKDNGGTEDACLTNGNFYTESADSNICDATADFRITSTVDVTGAGDVAAGKTLCQTGCTTAKADCEFWAFSANNDAATPSGYTCKLIKGTCTATGTGANSGDYIGTKTRYCYWTTHSAAILTNFDCKNAAT